MSHLKKLVVLTGAGISAESGLKTFRDSDGLWENYRLEDVATPTAWSRDPGLVLSFYNERRRGVAAAKPNAAHFCLVELQAYFDVQIITQNIDDLHERAGSSKVLHLHGEIFKMRSESNPDLLYPINDDIQLGDFAEDGYQLRPDVVWFGEPVEKMQEAILMAAAADVFVVIGTSLLVYPAASLIDFIEPGIPAFVLDKQVPTNGLSHFTAIQKSATEGISVLRAMLQNL